MELLHAISFVVAVLLFVSQFNYLQVVSSVLSVRLTRKPTVKEALVCSFPLQSEIS